MNVVCTHKEYYLSMPESRNGNLEKCDVHDVVCVWCARTENTCYLCQKPGMDGIVKCDVHDVRKARHFSLHVSNKSEQTQFDP